VVYAEEGELWGDPHITAASSCVKFLRMTRFLFAGVAEACESEFPSDMG
jgi:hypothetical protein